LIKCFQQQTTEKGKKTMRIPIGSLVKRRFGISTLFVANDGETSKNVVYCNVICLVENNNMPKRRVKVEALFFEDFPEDSETSFGRTMVDGTAEEWIEFLNKSYYKIISRKDIVGIQK